MAAGAVLTNVLEVDRIARDAPELERLLGEQLGRDELIAEGLSVGGDRSRAVRPRRAGARDRRGRRAARLPARGGRSPARRGRRADARRRALRRAPAPQDRRRAGRHPPRRRTPRWRAWRSAPASCARPRSTATSLRYEGEVLTSEALRARVREVCARLGAPAPEDIIVAPMRPGDAVGHEAGSGPLPAHAPICLDLWPQDEASGCWADMTRTWVRGDVVRRRRRPAPAGARGPRSARWRCCAPACAASTSTARPATSSRPPGTRPSGPRSPASRCSTASTSASATASGSRSTRRRALGRTRQASAVAGDVVAVEPGVVDPEHGGMRVEDLVLVTADGYELLTERSYDLVP